MFLTEGYYGYFENCDFFFRFIGSYWCYKINVVYPECVLSLTLGLISLEVGG